MREARARRELASRSGNVQATPSNTSQVAGPSQTPQASGSSQSGGHSAAKLFKSTSGDIFQASKIPGRLASSGDARLRVSGNKQTNLSFATRASSSSNWRSGGSSEVSTAATDPSKMSAAAIDVAIASIKETIAQTKSEQIETERRQKREFNEFLTRAGKEQSAAKCGNVNPAVSGLEQQSYGVNHGFGMAPMSTTGPASMNMQSAGYNTHSISHGKMPVTLSMDNAVTSTIPSSSGLHSASYGNVFHAGPSHTFISNAGPSSSNMKPASYGNMPFTAASNLPSRSSAQTSKAPKAASNAAPISTAQPASYGNMPFPPVRYIYHAVPSNVPPTAPAYKPSAGSLAAVSYPEPSYHGDVLAVKSNNLAPANSGKVYSIWTPTEADYIPQYFASPASHIVKHSTNDLGNMVPGPSTKLLSVFTAVIPSDHDPEYGREFYSHPVAVPSTRAAYESGALTATAGPWNAYHQQVPSQAPVGGEAFNFGFPQPQVSLLAV